MISGLVIDNDIHITLLKDQYEEDDIMAYLNQVVEQDTGLFCLYNKDNDLVVLNIKNIKSLEFINA